MRSSRKIRVQATWQMPHLMSQIWQLKHRQIPTTQRKSDKPFLKVYFWHVIYLQWSGNNHVYITNINTQNLSKMNLILSSQLACVYASAELEHFSFAAIRQAGWFYILKVFSSKVSLNHWPISFILLVSYKIN